MLNVFGKIKQMQDEFQGPGPEEMGLKPEDLSTEGTKPETAQNSDEELTGLARKGFNDEPGKVYLARL